MTNSGVKKTPVKKTSSKSKAANLKKPALKKKASPKKPAAKKSVAKKSAAKKTPKKKITAKKITTKKVPKKKTPATKKIIKKKTTNNTDKIYPVKPPFDAYKGQKPYLFCSYAHADMKIIFKIIDKIQKMGYRIWYDEGIAPGIEWPEAIGKALLKCDQYLVFLTPNAMASRNVRNEINFAYRENKDLLVIFLEETKLSGGMKLQLGTVHCIKKYELTDMNFYETLNKVLNTKIKK